MKLKTRQSMIDLNINFNHNGAVRSARLVDDKTVNLNGSYDIFELKRLTDILEKA